MSGRRWARKPSPTPLRSPTAASWPSTGMTCWPVSKRVGNVKNNDPVVQAAVDAKYHLIVAYEVTNIGHDRSQLANMARQAKEAAGSEELTVLADRGYFSGV